MQFDVLFLLVYIFIENKELFMQFPFVLQASGVWLCVK